MTILQLIFIQETVVLFWRILWLREELFHTTHHNPTDRISFYNHWIFMGKVNNHFDRFSFFGNMKVFFHTFANMLFISVVNILLQELDGKLFVLQM